MLVLHLGAEFRGLEQALAVPDKTIDLPDGRRHGRDVDGQPFVQERDRLRLAGSTQQHRLGVGYRHFLGVVDEAVVLRMEDVMDRSEADILVHPAVAGHEMRGRAVRCRRSRRLTRRHCRGRFRYRHPRGPFGTALCAMSARKAMLVRTTPTRLTPQPAIRRRIGRDCYVIAGIGNPVCADAGDQERETVGPAMKLP